MRNRVRAKKEEARAIRRERNDGAGGGGGDGAKRARGRGGQKVSFEIFPPFARSSRGSVYIVHGPFNSQMRRRFFPIPAPFRARTSVACPSRFLRLFGNLFFPPYPPRSRGVAALFVTVNHRYPSPVDVFPRRAQQDFDARSYARAIRLLFFEKNIYIIQESRGEEKKEREEN